MHFILYFLHGPPVFSILGRREAVPRGAGLAADVARGARGRGALVQVRLTVRAAEARGVDAQVPATTMYNIK